MDSTEKEQSHRLLCEIARCPEVLAAASSSRHPCSEIVAFQDRFDSEFQPPTPWVGRLGEAPILFIGSNPNIGGKEDYPTAEWSDQSLVDFFDGAFEGQRSQISEGIYPRKEDGSYGRGVKTWIGIRGRARELLQRDPVPGVDYAMTELVRCRSSNELGVSEAQSRCADLYLDRTVAMSPARVIVALGAHVREWLRRRWNLEPVLVAKMDVGGLERLVAFLPHPTSFGPKRFASVMPRELGHLQRVIADSI